MAKSKKVEINEIDIARGKRVKKLRSMAGLTAVELADRAGISRVSISFWENASRGKLSYKGAEKVIFAIQKENIDCSLGWLWDGKGQEPSFSNAVPISQESPVIPKAGYIFSSTEKEIEFFLTLNKEAVIVKIDDDKLWPYFEFNDLLAGKWQPLTTLRTESYCIVTLNELSTVRWVKKLTGAKNMSIAQLSHTPFPKESETEQVPLEKVAPIIRLWR